MSDLDILTVKSETLPSYVMVRSAHDYEKKRRYVPERIAELLESNGIYGCGACAMHVYDNEPMFACSISEDAPLLWRGEE